MRRSIAALVVLVATATGLAGLGGSAGAAAGAAVATGGAQKSLNPQLRGPFTGTTTFTFTQPCDFAHQIFDATYVAKGYRRAGFFHLDGCAELTSPDFTINGSFTLTTPTKAQVTGTMAGSFPPVVNSAPCTAGTFASAMDFTLTMTGGTKTFRHAKGTIHLTGTWCSSMTPGIPSEIFGLLRGHIHRVRARP